MLHRLLLLASVGAAASMAANSARTPASASRATGFQNPFAAGKVVPTGKGGPPPSTEAEGNGIGQLATDTAITALRLATCALMYHHGIDKIQNVDGFSVNVVAKYFGFLPGDPKLWTYLAAGTQVAGSGLLAAGIFSRPVALSMAGTMAAAVAFHLLNTGPEGFPLAVVKQHSYNYELAAMYVVVLGYFSAAGAGPFSVDQQVLGGEINFYKGLVGKVTGDDADEQ